VLWSIVFWFLKALVVVWALQLVVFALGVSLLSRRPRATNQAGAAKRKNEAIIQHGLEPAMEKPAAY